MARVLVTGATGFIGTHLVEALLDREERVAALVRDPGRASRLEQSGAQLVLGDVANLDRVRAAVAGASAVFHLAGVTKTLAPREFFEVNRRGVAHVARACAEQSTPPVLIVVSSLAASGPAIDGRPRKESDEPHPISWYGRSKRGGERAAGRYAGDVPITIVRPPIVFGEGDRLSLEMFKPVARWGVHPVPGLVPRHYSLIHADDLVEALLLAAARGKRLPPRGASADQRGVGCYFAACDEQPSWHELGRMIGRSLGRGSTLVVPFGARMVRAVGLLGELAGRLRGRQVTMNLDKAREATAGSWICSSKKAKEELGFSVAVPLAGRLAQTARWYQQEGWL